MLCVYALLSLPWLFWLVVAAKHAGQCALLHNDADSIQSSTLFSANKNAEQGIPCIDDTATVSIADK